MFPEEKKQTHKAGMNPCFFLFLFHFNMQGYNMFVISPADVVIMAAQRCEHKPMFICLKVHIVVCRKHKKTPAGLSFASNVNVAA